MARGFRGRCAATAGAGHSTRRLHMVATVRPCNLGLSAGHAPAAVLLEANGALGPRPEAKPDPNPARAAVSCARGRRLPSRRNTQGGAECFVAFSSPDLKERPHRTSIANGSIKL